MSLNVSQEALQALRNASTQAEEIHEQLSGFAKTLNSAYQDNCLGLGAHSQDIQNLLDTLVDTSSDAKKVKKLVKKLTTASTIIADHIESTLYGKGRSR